MHVLNKELIPNVKHINRWNRQLTLFTSVHFVHTLFNPNPHQLTLWENGDDLCDTHDEPKSFLPARPQRKKPLRKKNSHKRQHNCSTTTMSSTASRMALRVGIWIVLPSLLACLFSSSLVPPDKVYKDWLAPFLSFSTDGRNLASSKVTSFDQGNGSGTNDPILTPTCEDRFLKLLGLGSSSSSSSFTTTNNNHNSNENTFQNISFMMHRNGEGTPCGMTNANGGGGFLDELRRQYKTFRTNMDCPTELGKYEVEALLTKTFHAMLTTSCLSVEKDGNKKAGFLGYCDMGPHKTPIQLDHGELVPIAVGNSSGETFLPCHFHTREGVRITKLHQLTELVQAPSTVSRLPSSTTQHCVGGDETSNGTAAATSETCETDPENLKRHLYAVPAGRVFMFVANYVGEIIQLPHVEGANKNNIYLEVLSTDPRVFDVFNFFSREESKELVDRAIAETKESHRIKRSSTGASGHNLNSRRTSESGFDTHGKTAVKIKKRCFKALGFDEYIDSYGDGLQILRYNVSKAYNSHLDYIEDKSGELEHDFDSSGTGGNRFATILLYMSDLGETEGGETVFPKGWPPEVPVSERKDVKTAIQELRASEQGDILAHGSWEETLVSTERDNSPNWRRNRLERDMD